jgi:hypothetical protein
VVGSVRMGRMWHVPSASTCRKDPFRFTIGNVVPLTDPLLSLSPSFSSSLLLPPFLPCVGVRMLCAGTGAVDNAFPTPMSSTLDPKAARRRNASTAPTEELCWERERERERGGERRRELVREEKERKRERQGKREREKDHFP